MPVPIQITPIKIITTAHPFGGQLMPVNGPIRLFADYLTPYHLSDTAPRNALIAALPTVKELRFNTVGCSLFGDLAVGTDYKAWVQPLRDAATPRGIRLAFGPGWDAYTGTLPNDLDGATIGAAPFWEWLYQSCGAIINAHNDRLSYWDTEFAIWDYCSAGSHAGSFFSGAARLARIGSYFQATVERLWDSFQCRPIVYDLWVRPTANVPDFDAVVLAMLQGGSAKFRNCITLANPYPYSNPSLDTTTSDYASVNYRTCRLNNYRVMNGYASAYNVASGWTRTAYASKARAERFNESQWFFIGQSSLANWLLT